MIGTIQKAGSGYCLRTNEGDYRIHFAEKERLGIEDEHIGLSARAQPALNIVLPKGNFNGWVKQKSLEIVPPESN